MFNCLTLMAFFYVQYPPTSLATILLSFIFIMGVFYLIYPIKSFMLRSLHVFIKCQCQKMKSLFLVNFFNLIHLISRKINSKTCMIIFFNLIAPIYRIYHCSHSWKYKDAHYVGRILLYVAL